MTYSPLRPPYAALRALIAFLALAPGAGPLRAIATTRIFAWGDSMTYGYYDGTTSGNDCSNGYPDNNAPEVCGYPGRLGPRLNDVTKFSPIYDIGFINLGKGGEQTGAALSRMDRIDWTCPCDALAQPCRINTLKYWYCNGTVQPEDLLVLWEGTNDITNQVSVETISANLQHLGDKATALGLNVAIAHVAPRHPDAGLGSGKPFDCSSNGDTRANNLNDAIDTLASTNFWPEADPNGRLKAGDINGLFTSYYQDWDTMICSAGCDGTCSPADPVGHPNQYGYDAIACNGTDSTACTTSGPYYSKTFESAVRSALPPRLTLAQPSAPKVGFGVAFNATLFDVALTAEVDWDFGDGTAIVVTHPLTSPAQQYHVFSATGSRTVIATAKHANGSHRSSSILIQVTGSNSTIFVDGFESGGTQSWSPAI